MNIPNEYMPGLVEDLMISDPGITSVYKLRDITKKQFHSYTIDKNEFNYLNKLNFFDDGTVRPSYDPKDFTRFYKISGQLSDGQYFEFVNTNLVEPNTGEILFKSIDSYDIESLYKFQTNNILEPFKKYLTTFKPVSSSQYSKAFRTDTVYIPMILTDYCYKNNHSVSVYLNGFKVPNNKIFVFSNGYYTDFYIDSVFVKHFCKFVNESLAENVTIDVDVYNFKDTKTKGIPQRYRCYQTKQDVSYDGDNNEISIQFTPEHKDLLPIESQHAINKTALFGNGRSLHISSIIFNKNADGNVESVTIKTDTPIKDEYFFNNNDKSMFFEYSYLDSVKFSYFYRGIEVGKNTIVDPNYRDFMLYIKMLKQHTIVDGESSEITYDYLFNLYINDDGIIQRYNYDIINGCIPMAGITVYINGKRIRYQNITQTSRFSGTFETFNDPIYYKPDLGVEFSVYIEDTDDTFVAGEKYFEDIVQYGQDYYLANFLGTARAHLLAYDIYDTYDDVCPFITAYGGKFIDRAIALEKKMLPEKEWRVNRPDGTYNKDYFKRVLGSRDNIQTDDSKIELFDLQNNEKYILGLLSSYRDAYNIDCMTKINFSLTRNLLSAFGSEAVWDYVMSSDITDLSDYYETSLNVSDYKNPTIMVHLNRHLLSPDDFITELQADNGVNGFVKIKIPYSLFISSIGKGDKFSYVNVLEFQISETRNRIINIMRLFDVNGDPMDTNISIDNGRLKIYIPFLKDFFGDDVETSISQLVTILRIQDDDVHIFGSGKYGWIPLRNDSSSDYVKFKIDQDFIYIDNILDYVGDRIGLSNLFIYDTKFYYYKKINIDEAQIYNMFIDTMFAIDNINNDDINYNDDVNKIDDLSGLPVISAYQADVYANGIAWSDGIDCEIQTPLTNPMLATSVIIAKSVLSDNTSVEMFFREQENELIVYNRESNIYNKHGILYFEDLEYPFSLDYLDLFINGKKITPYDITILSDKMIRIGNIGNNSEDESVYGPIVFKSGFESVSVRTRFAVGHERILDLSSNFKISDMEHLIRLVFHNANPSLKEDDTNYPSQEEIDEIYSEFISIVDDFGGTVLGVENPVVPKGDALLTAYLEWLVKSKSTRSHALTNYHPTDKDMSDKYTFIRKFVLDFFAIYDDKSYPYDIVADGSSQSLYGTDILVKLFKSRKYGENDSVELYPRIYKSTLLKHFLDHFNEYSIEKGEKDDFQFTSDILSHYVDANDDKFTSFINGLCTHHATSKMSNIVYPLDYIRNTSLANDGCIMEIGYQENDEDYEKDYTTLDGYEITPVSEEKNRVVPPENIF